ncbi:OPT/YSL family transporter [Thermococcus piezophilus]|uniref:OPT/YSL family transporter n=1 Tax=Thermococcus piezophilus TaxID=1712654 RepID=UPI001F418EF8|nr:OPT/YSL family transporter [Thermococcus piezophilus]
MGNGWRKGNLSRSHARCDSTRRDLGRIHGCELHLRRNDYGIHLRRLCNSRYSRLGNLKGLLKKGTIVENNIVQTIAFAVNFSVSGVIFTIPALYIMGLNEEINMPYFFIAAAAGAILGITFIIPLRKQTIEIDRLRFPTGTAVLVQQFPILGLPEIIPEYVDLGSILHLPSWVNFTIALSLMVLGMGLITGRNGIIVLAGGVLSYYIITPLVKALGWIPSDVTDGAISSFVYANMTRPLGIGMLLGGSIAGLILSLPIIVVAIKSIAGAASWAQGLGTRSFR